MDLKKIVAILDTVITDLENPTTMRAPDSVYLNMKNRVIEARAALNTLEVEKVEPVKKSK